MNKLFNGFLFVCLLIGATILLLFVFDKNTTSESIHQMELGDS